MTKCCAFGPKGPLRVVQGVTLRRKIGGRLRTLRYYPPARVQRPRWTSAEKAPLLPAVGRGRSDSDVDQGLPGQRCKDGGADLLHRVRVFAVEVSNEILGVSDIGSGFPGVVTGAVAFPLYEVLELATVQAAVKDFINFVLLLAVNIDGCRRWRQFAIDLVTTPRG